MRGRQRRWRGGVAATVVLVVAGAVARNGALVLAALVPLAYVAAGSLSRVRFPADLSVRREVAPTLAPPGSAALVTLVVRNDSDRTVSDIRVADGVPEDLAVLSGTPRGGTALGPGEELEVQYELITRRGEYEFDPPGIRVRGPGAAAVATNRVEPTGDTRLECRLDADAPPIERHGERRPGQRSVDKPGWGVAFHSTREHHPDDPADRIDWRHYAKRGTLTTVNYERRVASSVVLVLDARSSNRVVAGRGHPTAVELAAYAATHALSTLLGTGHTVGAAVIGLDGPGPAGLHWLPPAGGRTHRARVLELLRSATESDDAPTAGAIRAADATAQVRKILDLAPPGTQFGLFSPVLDDPPVSAVETWRGAETPVVVLAPDVVPGNTVSGQYEQVRRRTRLARCLAAGATTVDWRRGTPLSRALDAAFSIDHGRATDAGRATDHGRATDAGRATDRRQGTVTDRRPGDSRAGDSRAGDSRAGDSRAGGGR